MLLDELHEKRHAIINAARAHGAHGIRVFGSVARGQEDQGSDIDFLVDFDKGYDLFTQRMALAERLAEITGHDVDLIPLHELNHHIRDAVLAEAREL
ncbi:nucleotidyltransferase domain-containing protein [Halomonas sp. 11-S5]|uniref:nucleotidyltransferase family protein n=1 Tax=Halomonas sp. 11-S5 TaxID=2994064 RepID=UPI002468B792|nr:nucleotidyltransferase domain-containing protein [Halomonas sp. 11-S5]